MRDKILALRIIPFVFAGLLVISACDRPWPRPSTPASTESGITAHPPQPTATVPTPVAATRALAPTTVPVATAAPTPTPLPTSTTQAIPQPGLLPKLVAQVSLAPTGEGISDLLLDKASGHLYVTDTAGQLHVLEADSLKELVTLPAAGALTLDAEHERLYASPLYDEGKVTVVDTGSLTVLGTVSPGGFVTIDNNRDRFYVGNQFYPSTAEELPGVRVYDTATLEPMGEIAQPGIPIYNPLRDELHIVAYTVHMADPDSLQITGDLLPEITNQPLAWCNGCWAATHAHIYPEKNLLVVDVTILSAGKGPGRLPPPRFFDATTLEELTDAAKTPPVERGCDERLILAEPVNDRVYRGERYSRYVSHNNLLVYDRAGAEQTWRDGLGLGVTNPNTGQMYVAHGDDTLVLDLAELSPVGALPPGCVHTLDAEAGRIYTLAEGDLLVFSERGAEPVAPAASSAGPLPAEEILSIQHSPDYARDRTLFVTAGGKLYRSTDGGQTWVHLRGGLPEGSYLTLDLAISPEFAADRTLFVGGFRSDFWGEGVHRSTDGGDSWQPMWQDLEHLRVYDVAFSPDYAADDTVLAYSRYQRISPWRGGLSVFQSTDQGLSWTLIVTGAQGTTLPPPEELLPPAPDAPAMLFRETDYGHGVERGAQGEKKWESLVITREPGFSVQKILLSPSFETDRTVYVLAEFDLFRSTDEGDTWARWDDGRLLDRDYGNKLTVATTSPSLDDGDHTLFVGTAAGEFWSLDPAEMKWEPIQIAEQWPTVLESEWVSEIETGPAGDVWLGTWGGGLAHYAGGEVQARFTITDGLPTQYISALALAPAGTVWAGGDLPRAVASYDGATWTPRPLPEDQSVGTLFDLEASPDGSIWAGAQAPGLLSWTGEEWEIIADSEGITGWQIYDIEIGANEILWNATARGLVFHSDGAWSGRDSAETKAIEIGPGSTAYLLTAGGIVWRHDGQQWSELPPPQEGGFLNGTALHAADDGAVWLGTYEGAFRYDGQAWRQFTAQDGLPANSVAAIAQDDAGWLWFGTEKGAARMNPAELALSPVAWPVTPAPTPTAQVVPTRTPAPQATPLPTRCPLSPAAPFITTYAEGQTAGRLGCPLGEADTTAAAFQPFEQGVMFWRANEKAVYVLGTDGVWSRHADTWNDSQAAYDASLAPPQGLLQPVRGFGKVWRDELGGPGADVGWALAEEQPYVMLVQPFASGQLFLGPWGKVQILYGDSTWESKE